MTSRGARLVLATAGLAFGAAALSWMAPSMPAGLAAACAPELVLRELLAGLTVLVLLLAPSFLADEPGRPAECHDGLIAALTAAPAAVALAAAGGMNPSDLLPAAGLLLACHLAASSALRLDPSGRRGILAAAAAAALLAGIPIAAYGLAEFGGWPGAAAAFRVSPLLAIRDVAGGWPAVGPAALLLVAIAALLRFGALLRKAPAAALVLVAFAPAENATVLVVGDPREGGYAAIHDELMASRHPLMQADVLPDTLPWRTTIVVLGRTARTPAEGAEWRRSLRPFVVAGGRVVAPDAATVADLLGPGVPPGADAADLGLGSAVAVRAPGAPGGPVHLPGRPLAVVRHPGDGLVPGVNADLFRMPFPSRPRHLPGRTLAYLGFLCLAFAGAVLVLRRGGSGPFRPVLVLGGIAGIGMGLLFLPGVLGDPCRIDRLVVEERIQGQPFARRVEILRVERLRRGGPDPVLEVKPGTAYGEVRFGEEYASLLQPDGSIRLDEPGRFALVARVEGIESPEPAGPWLAKAESQGGAPPTVFAEWQRSGEERVSVAGGLLANLLGTLRDPAGPPLLLAVPAEGPDAVVIHTR